jgi:hypothetical protein
MASFGVLVDDPQKEAGHGVKRAATPGLEFRGGYADANGARDGVAGRHAQGMTDDGRPAFPYGCG